MSDTTSTNGEAEQIRDYRDLQHSDELVRNVSNPDGRLYAYREGEEHIVVSRGNEPRTRWTKRVRAERPAVAAGEQLWTIPDNWEQRISIKGAAEARYAIYHIPETDVDVLVSVPAKNHLVDKWYGVKRVGQLTVTYDDDIAWGALADAIETARDVEAVEDGTIAALERLYDRRDHFEHKFAEGVDEYAEEALFRRAHEPVSVSEWTTEPWGDHPFETGDVVEDVIGIDRDEAELRDAVEKELDAANVIPSYPTVRVDVEAREGLPEGYDIRALAGAGAGPAATLDYLIVEEYDLLSQTAWGAETGRGQSSVSQNVSAAKDALDSR